MLTPSTPQTRKSAVLVLGSADPAHAGSAALALRGVAAVTADPERCQLLVRYDPSEVEAALIRRVVRPDLPVLLDDATASRLLLTAWPLLAKTLPVAASLL
jgi:hypothetical protein